MGGNVPFLSAALGPLCTCMYIQCTSRHGMGVGTNPCLNKSFLFSFRFVSSRLPCVFCKSFFLLNCWGLASVSWSFSIHHSLDDDSITPNQLFVCPLLVVAPVE